MGKRNVYIAIMVAAANGRGLRLSADEVLDLTGDDAIATCAHNCLSEAELGSLTEGWPGGWEKINPAAEREAPNTASGEDWP